MTAQDDVVSREQAVVDDLYGRAEALARQLGAPVQAASSVAARAAQEARDARLQELLGAMEDRSRLIAIGRVDFDGGTHADRTVYIGRTLIGDPNDEYPPMSSWRAEVAGAFYNPLGFEGGDVVSLKRAIVGTDQTVRDVLDEHPRDVRDRLLREAAHEQDPPPLQDPEAGRPSDTSSGPTPSRSRDPSASRKRPTRTSPAAPSQRPAQPSRRTGRLKRPELPTSRAPSAAATTRATTDPAPASVTAGAFGDPLVRQLLERQGTGLAPIIETIQARQYALMERPIDRTLVIQGGPGTGKTVIALHRVAVQLYRSRGQLAQSDILFVGPSRTFVRYVDRVLPSLGEHDVIHRAIQDLATHGAVPRGHDPADTALVKGLPQMAEVIDRFLRGRARLDRSEIRLGTGAFAAVSPETLGPVLERAVAEARNYADLRNRFRRLLSTQEVLKELVASDTSPGPSLIDPELADALAEDVVPTLSARGAIHDLLTSPNLLETAAEGLLTPGQQATIRRRAATVGQHPWTYEDFPLLDEAAEQLGGDRRPRRYAHVVIDEAQDFSAMQLRMVRRRVGGGITVLGDLAQASTGWSPATWDEHLGSGGIEVDDVEELTESYRTTRPILDVANLLLLVIDLDLAQPRAVIPDGAPVRSTALGAPPDDASVLASCIEEIRSTGRTGETVGVIGPAATLERIEPDLRGHDLEVSTVTDDVGAPLVLVPVDEAKGLEFDHVLLLEPERIHRTDPATGPRKLYVAMTRARTSLRLLHRDRLPSVLAESEDIVRSGATDALPFVRDEGPAAEERQTGGTRGAPRGETGNRSEAPTKGGDPPNPMPVRLQRLTHPASGSSSAEVAVTGPEPARPEGPAPVATGGGEIVLTDHPGIERRELIEHAERLGFSVRPDVTATTALLVVGRETSTSRRARIARAHAIPIATARALLATSPGESVEATIQSG